MVVNDVLRNLPLLRRVFSRKGWREGDAFAAVPNQGFNF
jgi:DNA-binding winged helix-turn-helix (wHTH) protein